VFEAALPSTQLQGAQVEAWGLAEPVFARIKTVPVVAVPVTLGSACAEGNVGASRVWGGHTPCGASAVITRLSKA
jgi:hypothetical protein